VSLISHVTVVIIAFLKIPERTLNSIACIGYK